MPWASALLLTACGTQAPIRPAQDAPRETVRPAVARPQLPPDDRYVRYVCADQQEMGITFQEGGRRALVVVNGWSHLLTRVASTGEFRFSDGQVTLRGRGSSFALDEGGRTTYRNCAAPLKR